MVNVWTRQVWLGESGLAMVNAGDLDQVGLGQLWLMSVAWVSYSWIRLVQVGQLWSMLVVVGISGLGYLWSMPVVVWIRQLVLVVWIRPAQVSYGLGQLWLRLVTVCQLRSVSYGLLVTVGVSCGWDWLWLRLVTVQGSHSWHQRSRLGKSGLGW